MFLQAALTHARKERMKYVELLLNWGCDFTAPLDQDIPTPIQTLVCKQDIALTIHLEQIFQCAFCWNTWDTVLANDRRVCCLF